MPKPKQKPQPKPAAPDAASRTAQRAFVVSVIGLVLTTALSGGALAYQVWKDRKQSTGVDVRIGKIETAIRLLTAHSAPEMLNELDRSLAALGRPQGLPAHEVKKTLASVSTTVGFLSAQHVATPQSESVDASAALLAATKDYPDVPEVWQAASAMVTYRSLSSVSFEQEHLRNCFDVPEQNYVTHPQGTTTRRLLMSFKGCEIDLADLQKFDSSAFAARFREEVRQGVTDRFAINLEAGRIVYHGGPIIPFEEFLCAGCTFDVRTESKPATPGRQVIERLLASRDLRNIAISPSV